MRLPVISHHGKRLAGFVTALAFSLAALRADIQLVDNMNYTVGSSLAGKSGSDGATPWATAWTNDPANLATATVTSPGLVNPFDPNTGGNAVSLTSVGQFTNTGNMFRDFGYTISDSEYATASFSFLMALNGNPSLSFTGISLFNDGAEVLFLGKPGNPVDGEKLGYQIPGRTAQAANVILTGNVFLLSLDVVFDAEGDDFGVITLYDSSQKVATWSNINLGEHFTFDGIRMTRDSNFSPTIAATYDAIELNAKAVPEPGTIGLVTLALGGVLFFRRRRIRD